MALNLQNIIDSNIAKSGGAGNFASKSNASLISDPPEAPSAVMPVKQLAAPQPKTPTISAPVPTSQVAANIPKPEAAPTNSQNIGQEIINLGNTDLTDDRQALRNDAQLEEKEERARRLSERIIARDNAYRDQREALEANPEGKLRGALNGELNELERNRSRELADLSFSYNIALGDFNAAQSAVDDRIADMEADIARKTKAYETAFRIVQNDLSESEKLTIQQAFQREQSETAAQNQKEIAQFKYDLDAPQRAYDNQIKAYKLAAAQAQTNSQGISPVTGKAFTQDQNNAGTFALRIEQAEDELSSGKGFFVPFLPNFAKTQDRRQFEQAEKNFITAVLRRESGAAISAEEFADARSIYIPIATDNEETLAQKAQARATVLQGMKNASVGAYDQLKTDVSTNTITDAYLDNLTPTLEQNTSPYSLYLN